MPSSSTRMPTYVLGAIVALCIVGLVVLLIKIAALIAILVFGVAVVLIGIIVAIEGRRPSQR